MEQVKVKGFPLPRVISELSFSIGLCEQLTEGLAKGREKNLLEKLNSKTLSIFKEVGSSLGRAITKEEKKQAHDLIMDFGKISGWKGKVLHPCTKINFLLALYDQETKKYAHVLIPTLMDIYEFFTRKKKLPYPVYWSAGLAADKWEAFLKSKGL